MSRAQFIGYLYDSILFECSGQISSGKSRRFTMDHLADCFRRVREMYEQDRARLLDMPSDNYIRQHRLDDPEYLGKYIKSLEDGNYALYPYVVAFYDCDCDNNSNNGYNSYNSYDSDSSNSSNIGYNGYSGYSGYSGYNDNNDYNNGGGCSYGDDYVVLVGLKTSDSQKFLDSYAKKVPEHFQNDIAYLIQGLRDNYWHSRGSGGTYDVLPNKLKVATKFAQEHNGRKRRKIEQKEADIAAAREAISRQEEEHRLKQEEEERKRLQREQEEAKREAEVTELLAQRRKCDDIVQALHRDARQRAAELRRIHETITQYIDKLQASLTASRAREDQVFSLRNRLEKELRARCHDQIKVFHFGSFASGLCCKTSDADMTLLDLGPNGLSIEELAYVLRQIQFHHVSCLPNAKVPVATFFDPATDLFCDVTIKNRMSVVNSRLIETYRRMDYRFSTLWFAVRQIAQKHEILSGSTGYLSSYALVMMLIVFLQDKAEPPILPKLQKVRTGSVERSVVDGYDCSFDSNWDNYEAFGSENTKSAGELLMDFLRYFGYTFNYATQEVNPNFGAIVLRSVNPISPPASDTTRSAYSVVIRDPFITDRNVAGGCRSSNLQSIKSCFQGCYDALFRGDIDTAFKR